MNTKRPLLSIGIIFRNDIRSIERCLKALTPLREAVPSELVMADTGSEDGSREIAEKYADILIDFPWVNDFSAARNAVMERCSGKWYFTVDTDEYLDADITQLVSFLQEDRDEIVCNVVQRNYSSYEEDAEYRDFMAARILRMDTGIRYEGAIHEAWHFSQMTIKIYPMPKTILHHDGYIEMANGTETGRVKTERNLTLLKAEIEKSPDNARRHLQLLESGSREPEFESWLYRAVDVVKGKPDELMHYGPPIMRYAVMEAFSRNLPELDEWTDIAKAWFPDSLFTLLDIGFICCSRCWNDKKYDDCIAYGKQVLKAMQAVDDGAAAITRMASSLMLYGPKWEARIKIILAGAYLHTGEPEETLKILSGVSFTVLETTDVNNFLKVMHDLHAWTALDTAPLIFSFWDGIGQPKPSEVASEARKKAFEETANRAIGYCATTKPEETEGHEFYRRRSSLYIPLLDKCDIGIAAALLEQDETSGCQALLSKVRNWNTFSGIALAHALSMDIPFPLPDHPLNLETMDFLAAQMGVLGDSIIDLALNTIQKAGNTQELCWSRALMLTTLNICSWQDDEQSTALVQAFVELEHNFLPCCYSSEALKEESLFLLPPVHRFGWLCVRAFEAKSAGSLSEFIALLHKGLSSAPEMKQMVEFLMEKAQQEQKAAVLSVSPELQMLAAQVKKILSNYPADDPAVVELKQSIAYQRVAYLLEPDFGNPIVSVESEQAPPQKQQVPTPVVMAVPEIEGKNIDRQFSELMRECSQLGEEKLFTRLRNGFKNLPKTIQEQQTDYLNRYPLWGSFCPLKGDYGVLAEKAKSLTEHAVDYLWLYDRLVDYRSKKLLFAVLNNWVKFDFTTLGQCIDKCFDDYFDLDILSCCSDEVVVDLGAYVGDTALSYVRSYGREAYQRYYCYEISPDSMMALKKNTACFSNFVYRQKGVGERASTMFLSTGGDSSANSLSGGGEVAVEVVALDEDISETITLLKMDIEGAEQAAIRGAERHIRHDRPKMALSVYHNNEDIWKIPRMIDALCPNCRFYLRYHGGNLWPTEISLLAIPD